MSKRAAAWPPEFPPPQGSVAAEVAGAPQDPEQIIIALAPQIKTEAELQIILDQVEAGPKRDAIEKCLREHGAVPPPSVGSC